ncbi:MAG: hypothetical protein WBD67_05260 [Terracidiphilus sp.]
MAVLTRKGGGLPANYREVHFWLNHVEVPEGGTARAEAEAQAAPTISEAAAMPVEEPVAVAEEAKTEEARAEDPNAAPVAEVAPEVAPDVVEALAEGGAEVPAAVMLETQAAEATEIEKTDASATEPDRKMAVVHELPMRGGTMVRPSVEPATEETAAQGESEESAMEENARGRGFWGFRRKKRA